MQADWAWDCFSPAVGWRINCWVKEQWNLLVSQRTRRYQTFRRRRFINERIRSVSWEWWKQRSVNDRGLAFRTEPPAYVHNEDSGLIHFLRDVWITLYLSDVLLKPVSHQRLNADKKWNGSAFKNHVQIKFPEEDYYHYYHYYYYLTFFFFFVLWGHHGGLCSQQQ